MKTTMKKIGGHRTSVEMAVENRKIVPFDRRGCGSLVTATSEPTEPYYISCSENEYIHLGAWIQQNIHDPALKVLRLFKSLHVF